MPGEIRVVVSSSLLSSIFCSPFREMVCVRAPYICPVSCHTSVLWVPVVRCCHAKVLMYQNARLEVEAILLHKM